MGRCPSQRNPEVESVVFIIKTKFFGRHLKTYRQQQQQQRFSKMSQLYQMPYVYPLVLRYTYDHFEKKSIVELMKCLWVYSDSDGKRCKVCRLYKNWAIEALEKKWLPEYIDFCTIVSKLKYRDPKFACIGHLPTGYSLYLRPIPRATTTASSSKTTAELLIAQHKAEKTSHNKFYNQTNNKYFFTKVATATTTTITAATSEGSLGYFY